MKSTDFTEISVRYERDSLVQRSASDKLIDLLAIQRDDDVLDVGCGPGNITRRLRTLTNGSVVGIDPSAGMIVEATAKHAGSDIDFRVNTVEGLASRDAFDVIFCNSVFQWFRDPRYALANCHAALKRGGRMGIQAPATKTYCPNFLKAIYDVGLDARTSRAFAGFRSPWLFLETAGAYADLFKKSGFNVPFATMEALRSSHTPDEAMAIFESGAAAGYLNQEHYSTKIDAEYAKTFREVVKGSFERQADGDGKIELLFNRTYLVAIKERQ
jgi:trans-aconitate methyltransferase